MAEANPTTARLEDQISWYDRKAAQCKWWFTRLKVLSISAAAMVPVIVAIQCLEPVQGMLCAMLGALAVVVEAAQHLNQYHANWIGYRSTCESLKHEKYLFLAGAGPYHNVPEPRVLLAERVESLVSQEHAKWNAVQEQPHAGTKPS